MLEKNQFYNKICFIISYNGNLRLKGENLPESQLVKKFIKDQYEGPEVSFKKQDFMLSIP